MNFETMVDREIFRYQQKSGSAFFKLRCGSKLMRTAPYKVKVKVTLVQALRLCTGRKAHRRSRGIAPPFHDHGTRRG